MQIVQGIDMLLFYPGTYDIYYASFITPYTGIYENNSITLYGTVTGTYCYDTTVGGTNCVPKIIVDWYTKQVYFDHSKVISLSM